MLIEKSQIFQSIESVVGRKYVEPSRSKVEVIRVTLGMSVFVFVFLF